MLTSQVAFQKGEPATFKDESRTKQGTNVVPRMVACHLFPLLIFHSANCPLNLGEDDQKKKKKKSCNVQEVEYYMIGKADKKRKSGGG